MSDYEILSVMLAMMTIIVTILIAWIKDKSAKKNRPDLGNRAVIP